MATATAVRVATPEIRWHCGPTGINEAVLSLDFLPACARPGNEGGEEKGEEEQPFAVLATGGADKEIKLWRVSGAIASDKKETSDPTDKSGKSEKSEAGDKSDKGDKGVRGLEFVFSLSGHDRSVNCVRFSPNGAFLASASDDTSIILWSKPKNADASWRWDAISSLSDVARTILACGHKGDITDLAWSPDSAFLCSTSVDNRCVIWNVDKGDVVERRKDHTQYVQGVAWDPLNEFLVTEGNDRTCRVYALGSISTGKKQSRKLSCVQTIKTREFPPSDERNVTTDAKPTSTEENGDEKKETEENAPQAPSPPAKHRMFLDDTCPAFARRPAWTPDGNYLLAPTGTFRATASTSKSAAVHTVYAFARGDLSAPTLHLPGHDKASLAVRCSPLLYELRRHSQLESGDNKGDANGHQEPDEAAGDDKPVMNFFQTPYRSVFAVVTLNAVVLYDTQQMHPICTLKDLHYADLTDASWSADGQMLSVSSMDGYLSFIHFAPDFFGARVSPQQQTELNDARTHRMFAVHKKTRKKSMAKSQATASGGAAAAANASADQAPTASPAVSTPNVLTVKKKRAAVTPRNAGASAGSDSAMQSPIARAFHKTAEDEKSAPSGPTPSPKRPESEGGAVNVLQVRKKRKITPTVVSPASASASSAAPSASPAAAAALTQVVDLSESTASADDQPQQQQIQQREQDQSSGTAEDPVEL